MDYANLINQLKAKLGIGAPQQPDRNASVYGLRDEYQRYVLDTQMQGGDPLPFGDYVRQKQMGNSPVAPVQSPGSGGIPNAAPGYNQFFKR